MKNLTDITIVLDRSGSMESVADDTIGGFNRFLAEQRRAGGDAVLSLVQFDDEYEVVYEARKLAAAAELDHDTFVPRGTTALYDALGRTIDKVGKRLARTAAAERPDKVVIVTITDGFENASRRFSAADVAAKVRHQTDVYNWEFVFIGANQDAVLSAQAIGISANRALSYAANTEGTNLAFDRMAAKMSAMRASRDVSALDFTEEERDEQRRAGAK